MSGRGSREQETGAGIRTEVGAVATITIDRPEILNAFDLPTLVELEETFVGLESNPNVRVIVFTGAGGRAFVAGGDIADLNSRAGLAHYFEFADVVHRVFRRIELCRKPTIGAVDGYALGGGMELLLSLDLRILSDRSRLGLPEIKLGLFPGGGGTQRLMRQVSPCRAKELMFTGDHISAEEAFAFGLANRVVPASDLIEETEKLAARIIDKSPVVLDLLKRTVSGGVEMPPGPALAYEQAMIGLVLDTRDAHEGCSAFLERRPPRFTGA